MSTQSATLEAPAATATTGTLVQPYIFFNGRCEEAFEFYKNAVGAVEIMKMHFNEAPEKCDNIPEANGNKVMHMSFRIGQSEVLASDGMCDEAAKFEGFSLTISTPNDAQTKKFYDALLEGGQPIMPLAKTFWASSYGMLKDKFGVCWMVMTTTMPPQQ
jgi:PhnB protein